VRDRRDRAGIGFQADPSVPGLPKIAWQQIEQRAQRAGVPMLLVRGALNCRPPTQDLRRAHRRG
jgi:hypothetical protein